MESIQCAGCRFYSPKDMYCHSHLAGIERIKRCAMVREVVPVVRCRECKYSLKSNEQCVLLDTRLRFYSDNKRWTEDSFCSWGEPQE